MGKTATISSWRIFQITTPEPHLQLSFATSDGLLVKNIYLKHPRRTRTIEFLKSIGGEGGFRNLDDLQEIIERANFRPSTIEWGHVQDHRQGEIMEQLKSPRASGKQNVDEIARAVIKAMGLK